MTALLILFRLKKHIHFFGVTMMNHKKYILIDDNQQ